MEGGYNRLMLNAVTGSTLKIDFTNIKLISLNVELLIMVTIILYFLSYG